MTLSQHEGIPFLEIQNETKQNNENRKQLTLRKLKNWMIIPDLSGKMFLLNLEANKYPVYH